MEFPPDKETMRSFLGMVNYLNRYSALSAHLAAPLSALTHQAKDYKPGKVHFENFNRIRVEVSKKGLESFQERTWCMYHTKGESGLLCFQSPDQGMNRIIRIWREKH